jgi:aminoglycoside phosphotransferase (APT) family kinase protein
MGTSVSTGLDGDAALASGLARWLTVHRGLPEPRIGEVHRPTAGYSSETIFVEATWADNGVEHRRSLVVRMTPSATGTFPHYDLVAQAQAQVAAAAVGVPVADPVVETDPRWIGAPFMLMPRVEGHLIGAIAHRDPWLGTLTPDERGLVHDGFVATLAAVHRADPSGAPGVPRRDLQAELEYWDGYLRWSSGGRPVPALAHALHWCRKHCPGTESEPVLLWGDARFENMVLGDDLAPRAVLDWDMTSVGAPEHDLAWFTSLDLTMQRLFGERVDGFPDRETAVHRFEALSGRPVRDLEWFETLAMVRSTAIMTRIGYLRRDAGKAVLLPIEDNPMLDLVTERLA